MIDNQWQARPGEAMTFAVLALGPQYLRDGARR